MRISKTIGAAIVAGLVSLPALANVNVQITTDLGNGQFNAKDDQVRSSRFESLGYTLQVGYKFMPSVPVSVFASFSDRSLTHNSNVVGDAVALKTGSKDEDLKDVINADTSALTSIDSKAWELGLGVTAMADAGMTGMDFVQPFVSVSGVYGALNHNTQTVDYLKTEDYKTDDVTWKGNGMGWTVAVGNQMKVNDHLNVVANWSYNGRFQEAKVEGLKNSADSTKEVKFTDKRDSSFSTVSLGVNYVI
jgi:hypothetical protein